MTSANSFLARLMITRRGTFDGRSKMLFLLLLFVSSRNYSLCVSAALRRLYWSLLRRKAVIEHAFGSVLRSLKILVGGFPTISDGFEVAKGSSFIPASICCRQCSAIFAISSLLLHCSDLNRMILWAINSGLWMTASVTLATVRGERTTFLKMCSINGSRVADRRSSTLLCWAVNVSSTNFSISFSTWKKMPVILSRTTVWSVFRGTTGLCLKLDGFYLGTTASSSTWNLFSLSCSMLVRAVACSWAQCSWRGACRSTALLWWLWQRRRSVSLTLETVLARRKRVVTLFDIVAVA